jgi:hypothetical protein
LRRKRKNETEKKNLFFMSGVAGSILQHVGEDLFEEHVVFPVASVIAELLESLPSVFVSFFPKFCGVSPKTLPVPVLASGLLRALEKEAASEVDEETSLALFVASAWIEENLAMYSFVEERLKRELGANFEFVEVVEERTSDVLAREVTEAFGPIRAFLFCVLSSVRLAPGSLRRMRAVAEAAHSEQRAEIDDLVRSCELLQTRVTTVSSPSVVSPVSQLSRSLDERALRQLATPSPARRWQLMRGVLPSPDQTRHRHAKMQEHRHHNLPDQQVHHHHHHQQQQQQHLGSHLARRVEAREHRGWLDKSRKVDLVESGVALASTARSWKRRWVVLEDGKVSWGVVFCFLWEKVFLKNRLVLLFSGRKWWRASWMYSLVFGQVRRHFV